MSKNSAPNRFAVSLNVILQVVLAVALLLITNVGIEWYHPRRLDLSKSDYYKLSEKSVNLVKSLDQPVDVFVFFQVNSQDPIATKVFVDIQNLLSEYSSYSPKLKVHYIDPDKASLEAENLEKEYGVHTDNVVVFSAKKGENEKRTKFINVVDMVEIDQSGMERGMPPRIKTFKGEQQFTSAIQNVVESKPLQVFFVQGHGEGDPGAADIKGFSKIGEYLRRENLKVDKVNLIGNQGVPKDCDLLVICSPDRGYADEELKMVREFLSQNGRLLVLLDGMKFASGLEPLLAEYGVKLGQDVVLLKIKDRLGGEALVPTAPGTQYANHKITESLSRESMDTLFPMCRSVDVVRDPKSMSKGTVLVESHPSSWAESNLAELQKNKATQDDKDRAGPVPLAVAVEPGSAGAMEREGMRLVVVGSSLFARNDGLKGANVDFFMNSVNWLLKRQQLMGIAGKTPQEFALSLNPFQFWSVSFYLVILMPSLVGFLGLVVWFKRRK